MKRMKKAMRVKMLDQDNHVAGDRELSQQQGSRDYHGKELIGRCWDVTECCSFLYMSGGFPMLCLYRIIGSSNITSLHSANGLDFIVKRIMKLGGMSEDDMAFLFINP